LKTSFSFQTQLIAGNIERQRRLHVGENRVVLVVRDLVLVEFGRTNCADRSRLQLVLKKVMAEPGEKLKSNLIKTFM
jgi:hypothetical protein